MCIFSQITRTAALVGWALMVGCKSPASGAGSESVSLIQEIRRMVINGARITANSVVHVNATQHDEAGGQHFALFTITLNAVNVQGVGSETDLAGQASFGEETVADRATLEMLRDALVQSPQGRGTAALGVRYLDILLSRNEPTPEAGNAQPIAQTATTTNKEALDLKSELEAHHIRRITYLEELKKILMAGKISYAYFKAEKNAILNMVGQSEVVVPVDAEAVELQSNFNRGPKGTEHVSAYLRGLKRLYDESKISEDYYEYEKTRALEFF